MKRKVRFLKESWIPNSDIALAAVSGTYQKIVEALESMGINTVQLPKYPEIAPPVQTHADMLIYLLEKEKILVPPSFVKFLTKEEDSFLHLFFLCESVSLFSSHYPHDVALNVLRIRDLLFCRPDSTAPEIKRFCMDQGITIIPVHQGYTRCSCAIIDKNSIITADLDICRKAQKYGIDVLNITPGGILLPGYDYGFIGGCCGLVGTHKMIFTGALESHPDGRKMKQWIEKKGVEVIELSRGPLLDIGGIVPLLEYEPKTL